MTEEPHHVPNTASKIGGDLVRIGCGLMLLPWLLLLCTLLIGACRAFVGL